MERVTKGREKLTLRWAGASLLLLAVGGSVAYSWNTCADHSAELQSAVPPPNQTANSGPQSASAPVAKGRTRLVPMVRGDSSVQVWREEAIAGASGAPAAVAGLQELPASARGKLNEEEQAVLREHPVTELGELIIEADNAYLTASEANRPAAEQRYHMLLALWSKLTPYEGPTASPQLLERQHKYLQALPREKRRLAGLPREVRAARLDAFKERFFHDL